ncbi:uncharacterized protein [Lolium perenne]|uniref:uncharacterized protein isoform X2 n=1 Tax=Lolium perenne TaxID=4522 RepID=UPI003A9A5B2F
MEGEVTAAAAAEVVRIGGDMGAADRGGPIRRRRMEEGSDYYVVKKGDMVGVYKTLNDCQAQICSSKSGLRNDVSTLLLLIKHEVILAMVHLSLPPHAGLLVNQFMVIRYFLICPWSSLSWVSGPAASAYKGYRWSKEKAEYLSSRGLINASYTINAADFREDLLGTLVPCTFQEITGPSSNQLAPNLSGICNDTSYQPGIRNDIRYQPGTQPVDLNYSAAGSSQTQGYSGQEQAFSRLDAKPRSSSHSSPNNTNHSGAFDAQPVSKQYMVCVVHFDGASKGNPGKSGAGAVLMTEDGRVISRLREGLGVATNNVAEYRGLILGLKYAIRLGFKRIKVYGDSQLVCYQVKGTWQAKKENMMELCKEVKKLQENFISFEVNHVRREWNSEADRQANIAVTLASGAVSEERGDGF